VVLNLPHGHIWTFNEVDVFVDSVLRDGPPLPRLDQPKIDGDRVRVKVISPVPVKEAVLNYTTDSGEWQKRRWQSSPAELTDNIVIAHLPEQRPLAWYLAVTDERGLRVSTEHEEWLTFSATP
jgi:hypothetical protein